MSSNKTVKISGFTPRTEVHVDEADVCKEAVRIALRNVIPADLDIEAYVDADGVWAIHHDGHHGGYKTQHGTATAKERDDRRTIEAFARIVGVRVP